MADTHVLFALRRKYAERLGAADHEAVDHLAPVIRLFSPNEDIAASKPVRPYTNLRGTRTTLWLRSVLDVLRTANAPMSVGEIAKRIAAARDITDRRVRDSIENAVLAGFKTREGVLVVSTGEKPRRWALIG